jgi:hypothetical protein
LDAYKKNGALPVLFLHATPDNASTEIRAVDVSGKRRRSQFSLFHTG